MNEERFWLLVSQQLAGEVTPEELEEMNAYMQQHPEKGLQVEIMRNMWKNGQITISGKSKSFDKHLQRLSSHLSQPVLQYETTNEEEPNHQPPTSNHKPYRRILIVATAAAALLIWFFVLAPHNESKTFAVKP